MRNPTIAIAVIAAVATSAASAQSSVTLFGVVDAAVSHYEVKSSYYDDRPVPGLVPEATSAATKRSQTALSNSGLSSSRIGFLGKEDLGGGLWAGFWLESSVANDTGASGIGSFTRRSTLSLGGPFGEIRLGRDYTPSFRADSAASPFGVNGVGINLLASVSQQLAISRAAATGGPLGVSSSDNYVRSSNSIGYFLPPGLGGIYGQFMYALPENTKIGGLPATESHRGRYVGGRLGYAKGPLDIAVAYGESTVAESFSEKEKIKTLNLSLIYDLKVVKLFGELSQVKDVRSTSQFTPSEMLLLNRFSEQDKYNGLQVGASIPIGVGAVRLAYARVRFKDGTATPSFWLHDGGRLGATTEKFALGYVHNLSKRTALYATFAHIRMKDAQNNPAVMGITTGGSPAFLSTAGSGAAAGTGYAPRSANGYDIGIRHAF